jgi:hypothetical protein
MPTATHYADRINMGACPGCDSFGRCSCDDEDAVDPALASLAETPEGMGLERVNEEND